MTNQLYSQGTHKIEIVVRKDATTVGEAEGTKERTTDETGAKEIADAQGTGGEQGEGNSRTDRRPAIVKVGHVIGTARHIASLGINYYIQGIGRQQGDNAYQDYVARRMEIFNDAASLGLSVVMGARFGAAGGPVAMASTAAFMFASQAASLMAKYANRERDFRYDLMKQEQGVAYQRSRAEINLTTGRLR